MKQISLTRYVAMRKAFVAEKAQLEARLAAINQALNGAVAPAAGKPAKKKRTMSAAARAKIAAAQRARWAKVKAAKRS